MQLEPGLVIALPDPRTRPKNKQKWHICVCPEKRLFLRINSKPLWPPWHLLPAARNVFLNHNSYVELASLHFFTESELRRAKKVGALTGPQQLALADTALTAETLNDEQRELIWEKFGV